MTDTARHPMPDNRVSYSNSAPPRALTPVTIRTGLCSVGHRVEQAGDVLVIGARVVCAGCADLIAGEVTAIRTPPAEPDRLAELTRAIGGRGWRRS